MTENRPINRRDALKQAGLLLGYTISGPALAGVIGGCTAKETLDWLPSFLTGEEASLVKSASSRILPSGDTPGAADAPVTRFIDEMLAEYYLPEAQQIFRSGLEDLELQCRTLTGKKFVKATEAEQDQILSEMANQARKQVTTNSKPFFLMLKELTILGFFTSEVGATQFLNFDEIPGGYQGCAPLESVGGKTWAT